MNITDILLTSQQILGRYLKGNRKKCQMESMNLTDLPFDLNILQECQILIICKNRLNSIPNNITNLINLTELDISFNVFKQIPKEIGKLKNLKKFQAHHNQLENINKIILKGLIRLEILNLNNNELSEIPETIGHCRNLQKLFCSHNLLENLPESISQCHKLVEINCGYNKIVSIPESIGDLFKLQKLILHKNRLEFLPENVVDLVSLKYLDIAANNIQVLPSEINDMSLEEFYFECNPLLQLNPVSSQQIDEVMPLAELALRVVSKELQNRGSYLHVKIRHYPEALELLDDSGECALCGGSYRDVWIECVEFIDRSSNLKSNPNSCRKLPIRAAICSHRCFNSKEHRFYGVANVN